MSKLGLKREGGSVVTRQFPRALSSLRVRTNIFHQKILAKGCENTKVTTDMKYLSRWWPPSRPTLIL